MTIVIDPVFSVYQLVQRTQQHKHLIRHRQTMSEISFAIEDAALEAGRYTRLFAGFQYLSKFLPQLERYRKLAKTVESIYVFGIPDVAVPPIDKVTYIHVTPGDQLSKEWFVVCYGQHYSSALATEEISRFHDPDAQRAFSGVWTFNPLIVSIIGDWISSAVDAKPIVNEVSDGSHQAHVQTMIRTMRGVINRLDQRDKNQLDDRLVVLQEELEMVINEELGNEMDEKP